MSGSTADYGHASSGEIEQVRRIEAHLAGSPDDRAAGLALALLYLDPCHREEDALRLLRNLHERYPDDEEVALWLSFALIRFGLDEPSLRTATRLLEGLTDAKPSLAAAAYYLLAEARQDLGILDDDEKMSLLARSVEVSPDWVENRSRLARVLARAGRVQEARSHLLMAAENVRAGTSDDVLEAAFEERITYRERKGARDEVLAELAALDVP